jgi:subtilisin
MFFCFIAMAKKANSVSRRNVLKVTSGTLAATGLSGLSSAARDDEVEVNVGYAQPSGRDTAKDRATRVRREFKFDGLTIKTKKRAAEALQQRSDIRYVEANNRMHAFAESLPWGVDRIDADTAHESGYTGSGADIAIIDTGIDSNHPDLQANLGTGKTFVGSSWEDDNGHGTHCAGIANAVDNSQGVIGVSTSATLHAVKVLNSSGGGSYSDIASGIEYVADQGWDVGSLSLGGSQSAAVADAVQYAYGQGVFLATAAGNDGPCTNCVSYPAAEPECVAISSTNSSDGLSYFSSQGPEIELAAPGSSIFSTYYGDTYDTLSGTSMATPHVAGAAGLLMANGYSNTEARDQLSGTAENLGLSGNEQGSGLLDVAAALGLDSSDN